MTGSLDHLHSGRLGINLQRPPNYFGPCYCQLISNRKTYTSHACLVESTKKPSLCNSLLERVQRLHNDKALC